MSASWTFKQIASRYGSAMTLAEWQFRFGRILLAVNLALIVSLLTGQKGRMKSPVLYFLLFCGWAAVKLQIVAQPLLPLTRFFNQVSTCCLLEWSTATLLFSVLTFRVCERRFVNPES